MATLKSLVDETTNIKNEIVECHSNLSSMLISKNVEVSEEDKMSDLIGKVDMLGEYYDGKLWLYKEGYDNTDITGGFIVYKNNANATPSGTFVNNEFYIELDATNGYASCGTYNKIDVSKYKTLYIDSITDNSNAVCCFTNAQNLVTSNRVATAITTTNERGIASVDISNLSSLYYLGIGLGTSKTKVYNIWLEE